jgi:hypothetical protein
MGAPGMKVKVVSSISNAENMKIKAAELEDKTKK